CRSRAEVRNRGDGFWIAGLGSANGPLITAARLTAPVQLRDRDIVRIGETEIEYSEHADTAPARGRTSILFSDSSFSPLPEATITAGDRNSAANLISSIESSNMTLIGAPGRSLAPKTVEDNALAVISRVSLTLLSGLSLDDTLQQVLECVFEVVSADRGYVMLFEAPEGDPKGPLELICKAMKMRTQGASNDLTNVEISRAISER